jgi:hypothetical protein
MASDRRLVDENDQPKKVVPLKQLSTDHPDFPHNDTGWQYGCRCDICRDDHNERRARWRRKAGVTKPGPYIPKSQRVAQCGTRSGYNRHRRLGEDACADCLAAASKYQAAYAQGMRLIDPAIEDALRAGM